VQPPDRQDAGNADKLSPPAGHDIVHENVIMHVSVGISSG
jgi:hypothetical protein